MNSTTKKRRRNAVTHGLTATTLLPEILGGEHLETLLRELADEWRPATPTENFLVRELARHAAVLRQVEAIEQAALRRSSRAAVRLAERDEQAAELLADVALAGAGTADAIERVSRYRRMHERAFAKALAMLQALRQAERPCASAPDAARAALAAPSSVPTWLFADAAACEAHLVQRLVESGCAFCGSRDGTLLRARGRWQCRGCHRQSSPRSGTVLEHSPLDAFSWLRAIELLLRSPAANLEDLAAATGIKRPATLRRMAGRIRQAQHDAAAERLLAGIPALVSRRAAALGGG